MITAIIIITYAAMLDKATQDFSRLGFEATPLTGGNLMITGEKSLFKKVFGTTPEVDKFGTASVEKDGHRSTELPTENLPESIRSYVKRAGFQERIDFGPTSY